MTVLLRSSLACASLNLFAVLAQAQGFDTVAVITSIEQRMADIEHLSLGAVFLTYPGQEAAVRLRAGERVEGSPSEKNELYVDPNGSVAGVTTYVRNSLPGITESSCHYFAEDGHTIAASWTMRWLGSECTDSIAVQTRYAYFHPAGEVFFEYATMQDARGRKLDHTKCMYPDIDRHFDAYYHRDMLLMSKNIITQ